MAEAHVRERTKKLNILIVCQYYYPEPFLIHEIAEELVKRQHKVTVLTGLPNYPEGKIYNGYQNGEHRDEVINGVRVIRCDEVGRFGGKLNLIRNYISYAKSASKKAKSLGDGFDLVFCYQLSPVMMLAPAVAYKKKYHTPLLTYCLDIWPESAKAHIPDKGIFKFAYKTISAYSAKLYKACDHIAVTSEPFIQYLREVDGVSADRLSYIPQHSNGEMLGMDLKAEENGLSDFMFAGNLGKGQKLEAIIQAVAKVKKQLKEKDSSDQFMVHIVGDGSMKSELERLTDSLGVSDNVVFHGRKSKSEMPKYYQMADALLITLRGNNFVGNTMPGKLQTYMTAGKPIFGSINGAAMQVIQEAGCGKCVGAEDPDGLAKIMLDYIENADKYDSCGEKARSYFQQHFTMDVFMDSLEKTMRKVTDGCS